MVGHVEWHRLWYVGSIEPLGYCGRGDETHHSRALGIPAEHHFRFRTAGRDGLNVIAGVSDSVDCGGKICGGRVIDCVYPEGLRPDLRLKGIDECLSDCADPRGLSGAPGEHRFHVRAALGGRGWNRDTQYSPSHNDSGEEASDETCTHVSDIAISPRQCAGPDAGRR